MARTKRIYFETSETITKTKKSWIEIDLDYTQFYTALGGVFAKCESMISIKLTCWAFSEINKENMFTFNNKKIAEFNRWIVGHGGKPYNERSVYTGLKELINLKVVLKWSNGAYQLNPAFIWSDITEKREKHLQELEKYTDFEIKSIEE